MSETKKFMNKSKIIVLYQGDCTFCRWCVELVLRNSKAGVFTFIPIDSDEGKTLIVENKLKIDVTHPDSIAVLENGKASLYKWRAGVSIARSTTFPFKFVYYVAVLIPHLVGDIVYDWVGRHRNLLCKITRCNKKKML